MTSNRPDDHRSLKRPVPTTQRPGNADLTAPHASWTPGSLDASNCNYHGCHVRTAKARALRCANELRPDDVAMISGIRHLGLTARAVDASATWYERVLGFQRVDRYDTPHGARRKVFLSHDRLNVRLGLTQHRDGNLDDFDDTRIGLDHLAFAVQNREDLDSWAARLADAAVKVSPIVPANTTPGAFVLVLRDPDNIQLELFADPSDTAR